MTDKHPISPPQELVQQWGHDANLSGVPHNDEHWAYEQHIATRAAQWGADQELKACCEWISQQDWTWTSAQLCASRRPKPPSAIEQAESLIERHEDGWVPNPAQWHVIREGLAEGRRALEALPND